MEIIYLQEILITFAFGFLAAFVTVPFIIENSRKVGIVGKNRNKANEATPEMGGIAIVAGISIGVLAAIAFGANQHPEIKYLLAAISTVLIMGILGLLDDLYSLKKLVKAPIPFIAAIPLSAVRAGTRNINFPIIGSINFGSWYPLGLVPLAVGGASNAFNMLAGLNGLEAGMGLIISLAIFIAAYMRGSYDAIIISISLFASCLAFLYYNRYPAKIFPGDVGTYTIGATIASAIILGNLEFFGLFLFAPYFFEFAIKATTGFKGQSFGILKNGKLTWPGKPESITHIIMKLGPMTEKEVVKKILTIEVVVASIGLFLIIT